MAGTTNNRMELFAAISGLGALKEPCNVRLYSDSAYISGINWIHKINDGDIQCKFRYRQSDNQVHIKLLSDNEALLTYPQKIKAVTPGQQAVFYDDGELLGGGVIENTYINGEDLNAKLMERVNG